MALTKKTKRKKTTPSLESRLGSKRKVRAGPGGAKTLPALRCYFGYCLYKSAMRMREGLDHGLTSLKIIAPQLGILLILKNHGALSQIELGSSMAIDRASMVKMLDGLEKLGFIERRPNQKDRRENLIALTSAGMAAEKKAGTVVKQVERRLLSKFSTQEAEILRTLILKFYQS